MSPSSDPTPVHVIEHADDCGPSWFGDWLAAAGCGVEVSRPYLGEALPSVEECRALVVLGGPMGADDDAEHAWLAPTRELVRSLGEAGRPVLGICLGHQLVARAYGATVRTNPAGQQLGVTPIGFTEAAAADPLLGSVAAGAAQGRPVRGVHWNDDIVVDLPEDAVLLASAPGGEVQAVRFAAAVWGVQWHPEVLGQQIKVWAVQDSERHVEADIDQPRVLAEIDRAEAELIATWRLLADSFALLASQR